MMELPKLYVAKWDVNSLDEEIKEQLPSILPLEWFSEQLMKPLEWFNKKNGYDESTINSISILEVGQSFTLPKGHTRKKYYYKTHTIQRIN